MTISQEAKPTSEQYAMFERIYDHLNETLFGGELPPCLITLQRHKGANGYFWGDIFEHRGDGSTIDEIAMNPTHFDRPDIQTLSTLAHEMAHLWQHHFGKPSRSGYHNKEWARKMVEIGLIPSHTGAPGGKQTGQKMTHYIESGGRFEQAIKPILDGGLSLKWRSKDKITSGGSGGAGGNGGGDGDDDGDDTGSSKKAKNKIKYACAGCRANVWGKPGMNVICGDCGERMESQE